MGTPSTHSSGLGLACAALPLLGVEARSILSDFANDPRSPGAREEASALKREWAEAIASLEGYKKDSEEFRTACEVVEAFHAAGLCDEPADEALLPELRTACRSGWHGLLSALLSAPAWQLAPAAPRIADTPLALWPAYVACLLRVPPLLHQPGQAEKLARHHRGRLGELVALAETNGGSRAVRGALERFGALGDLSLLLNSREDLTGLLILRARLAAIVAGPVQSEEIALEPRAGRRTRIGFVLDVLEDVQHVRAALPWIENLDSAEHDGVVFVLKHADSPLEERLARRVSAIRSLDSDFGRAAAAVRACALDAVVFFTRVLRPRDPVSRLALERLAPIQAAVDESGLPTCLPGIDLHLVRGRTGSEQPGLAGVERAGLVPECGVPPVASAAGEAPARPWTRSGLGLDENAVLIASTAPFRAHSPEWLAAAAGLLARVPAAKLMIFSHHPEDFAPGAAERMGACLDRFLEKSGVDLSRGIVAGCPIPPGCGVAGLLRITDLYLDAGPGGHAEGCLYALEAGIPVVAWEGAPGRPHAGAQALRLLGLDRLVARGADEAAEIARTLAADPAERARVVVSVQSGRLKPGNAHDPVAFGEAWAALLDVTLSEVAAWGAEGFRSVRTPVAYEMVEDPDTLLADGASLLESGFAAEAGLRARKLVARHPSNAAGRELHYRILLARGRPERTSEGVGSTLAAGGGTAGLWFLMAQALRAQGLRTEAVTALRNSLRIDGGNVEGWMLLAQFARESANFDLLGQISRVTTHLAPNDPRCASLAAEVAPEVA